MKGLFKMSKFADTIRMSKSALDLARDIFSDLQKPGTQGGCEYFSESTVGLNKCKHSKNKKVIGSADDARAIQLSCTLTNCPFISGK
jgi:hypothetical protein